jgi:type IV secretory pathway component VirB8
VPAGDKGGIVAISPDSRAKFEKLGLNSVRKDIGMGWLISDHEESLQARAWVREQEIRLERYDRLRFWSMLIFTFIAAVAACIAAEPILKDWIWTPNH